MTAQPKTKEKEVEGNEIVVVLPSNLSVSLTSTTTEMPELIAMTHQIIERVQGRDKDKPTYT